MSNEKIFPIISEQIYTDDVLGFFRANYNEIGGLWWSHQIKWITEAYSTFKDLEKYLIVIFLVKKTLDTYNKNLIRFTYKSFYEMEKIEIEKFNIVEISKALNLPKETARRKITELENTGKIQRYKKKIILDRTVFPQVKPINSTVRISTYLSKFSELLKKDGIIRNSYTSQEILEFIHQNFINCWALFLGLQIPIILRWKTHFKSIDNWFIWAICGFNKTLNKEIKKTKRSIDEYADAINETRSIGLNAMSISEMSGIPRATVVRKLNYLVKNNSLIIDSRKHYHPNDIKLNEIKKKGLSSMTDLANFCTNIFNLMENSKINKF